MLYCSFIFPDTSLSHVYLSFYKYMLIPSIQTVFLPLFDFTFICYLYYCSPRSSLQCLRSSGLFAWHCISYLIYSAVFSVRNHPRRGRPAKTIKSPSVVDSDSSSAESLCVIAIYLFLLYAM